MLYCVVTVRLTDTDAGIQVMSFSLVRHAIVQIVIAN